MPSQQHLYNVLACPLDYSISALKWTRPHQQHADLQSSWLAISQHAAHPAVSMGQTSGQTTGWTRCKHNVFTARHAVHCLQRHKNKTIIHRNITRALNRCNRWCYVTSTWEKHLITSDKGGGKCICPRLSVCLLARLLKNACMDLDKMLHVDRCRDMDELINFWAWYGL